MNTQTITKEFVLEMLEYFPSSGLLLQKKKRPKVEIGAIAGVITNFGYRYIQLQGKKYAAHRLVWLIETGSFPSKFLDHIDGNKAVIGKYKVIVSEAYREQLISQLLARNITRVG